MTQEDIAEGREVSRQSVSKWENGDAMPDAEKLIKLGCVLGVSLDELAGNGKIPAEEAPQKVIESGKKPLHIVLISVFICLAAAIGFIVGKYLLSEKKTALPDVIEVYNLHMTYDAYNTLTVTFSSNVTADGKVLIYQTGDEYDVHSRTAAAKNNDGIYCVKMRVLPMKYKGLTFTVTEGDTVRSVSLASDIELSSDFGVSWINVK